MVVNKIDTIIVGGGQSGLSVSYYLTQKKHDHLLLDANKVAHRWRELCWDSFFMITPNWMLTLPGQVYSGNNPNGYMSKNEIVRYIEQYAKKIKAPIKENTLVKKIDRLSNDDYIITTNNGLFKANNVVIATSIFQHPKLPAIANDLPLNVLQIHSSHYKNLKQLPDGNVLVVGAGQSGCQIAEELLFSQKNVYLSTSKVPNIPRHYRGRDIAIWLNNMGRLNVSVKQLPFAKAKFLANAPSSGRNGGITLNAESLWIKGVKLLGHLEAIKGDSIYLRQDVKENLLYGREFHKNMINCVNKYIEENNINASAYSEEKDFLFSLDTSEKNRILNLKKENITSIIWCTGYKFDFDWINLPVFDDDGYPIQKNGKTAVPGLYFVGMHWQRTAKSGLLYGVGEDAALVVKEIIRE